MITHHEFAKALHDGDFDHCLTEILSSTALRRDMLRQITAADKVKNLTIGDTIVISSNCKPKMLAGARVTYEGRENSKLKVRLRRTYSQKWREGNTIRIPISLVGEVLASSATA